MNLKSQLKADDMVMPVGTASPSLVLSSVNEDASTKNIISQLKAFTEKKGLLFFNDVSKIIVDERIDKFYTKYSSARPDGVTYNESLVARKDYRKMLYQKFAGDDEDDTAGDDVSKLLSHITLNQEHKRDKNAPKDPVGQLFAGMEKTLGDVFFKNLDQKSYLKQLTMYGFYVVPSENSVTVYRANVEIGKPTRLPIQEAFNRVMCQLLQCK